MSRTGYHVKYYVSYRLGNEWPDSIDPRFVGVNVYGWIPLVETIKLGFSEKLSPRYTADTSHLSSLKEASQKWLDNTKQVAVRVASPVGAATVTVQVCIPTALIETNCTDGLDDDCDGKVNEATSLHDAMCRPDRCARCPVCWV